jgi:hypothetical protein
MSRLGELAMHRGSYDARRPGGLAFSSHLAYARRLREAGVNEQQAEAHAQALAAAMTDTLATKQDLREMSSRIDARFDQIVTAFGARFDQVVAAFDARFDQVVAAFDSRFANVDSRFANVDSRFANVDSRFAHVDARFDQ